VNLATLRAITGELDKFLTGQRFGILFTLSRFQFAADLRLPDSRYLFISVEPSAPRIYLIKRRLRDLEKQASNASSFAVYLQKRLSGLTVRAVRQIEDERVIAIDLTGIDEMGTGRSFSLVAQLTGRSANLFLLDAASQIIESLRETQGVGQNVGDTYSPPAREGGPPAETAVPEVYESELLSDLLDQQYLAADHEARFRSLANTARANLKRQRTKLERLIRKLDSDAAGHGEAEKWKRFGDLLLANTGTAMREGGAFRVVDYYDESTPTVEVPADENATITEAAETYFKRYTKARNAAVEIEKRRTEAARELDKLDVAAEQLEHAIAAGDESAITELSGEKRSGSDKKSRASTDISSAVRSFLSSDGFEILVGKKAKDNDQLSFKIAKSLDIWMHAADYPGSHVVVRNPNRREIPPRTLLEAAQLAAFYSQGRTQVKAAVNYTQKKFVNKPRGAAPGLVSLASFKTILVEPQVPDLVRGDR
jgi:predicted ribosome quality control (RQC) complex YloA/Tae2 family protein